MELHTDRGESLKNKKITGCSHVDDLDSEAAPGVF